MRIVQLGWASGPTAVSRIVKPDGFVVAAAAAAKHSITQDRAMQEGLPLKNALTDFINDALSCVTLGGCLVAHHIEQHT